MPPYPRALEAHATLRQSLLGAFADCPLQARLGLDLTKGWSGHLQAMGQLWHRFAARALAEMARQGEDRLEVDVALAIMLETLRQADVDDRDLVAVPLKQVRDLRWMTIKWATDNRFDVANLVDVEQRLSGRVFYPDPEGGEVDRVLTGQLDALFIENEGDLAAGHAIVLDWKSGWGLPPAKEVSDAGYFQQRFYGWLVMRRYPTVQRVTLREAYVRFSEVREAHLSRGELDDVELELSALAERFDRATHTHLEALAALGEGDKLPEPVAAATGAFRPAPGAHCSYCPSPSACPIYPEARGEGRIGSPEDAAALAAELVVAEAAAKQAKAALRAWTGARGPTPLRASKDPNRRWGPVESRRVERPSQEALEAALAHGVDPRSLYRERTYTRFGQHSESQRPASEDDAAADAALEAALAESIDRARAARGSGRAA